ncbi:MAG: outer membrane protein transport protein [Pseudomonadota bacterium]
MKKHLIAAAGLGLSATVVQAGGIERTNQSVGVLFEEGRHLEFSIGYANPDVSGVGTAAVGGGASGNLTEDFFQLGAAFKSDINSKLSYAIIVDQPYGADVAYPLVPYFAAGSTAEFNSVALTGLLRYKTNENFSVYGGLRLQAIDANANIPFVPGYTVDGDREWGVGAVVGVAYEIPDIALRVSLTYNSEIAYDVATTETITGAPGLIGSTTEVETPQSVHLEFQSGVAENTLVFGGIRWVDWSDFDITPLAFAGATGGPLIAYENDYVTYTLGVAYRFNETWAMAGSISYEEGDAAFMTNLGPTDGSTSLSLAAIYTQDNMEITTGIRYTDLGNAQTRAGAAAPAAIFEDNDAVSVGVSVAFKF